MVAGDTAGGQSFEKEALQRAAAVADACSGRSAPNGQDVRFARRKLGPNGFTFPAFVALLRALLSRESRESGQENERKLPGRLGFAFLDNAFDVLNT